MPAVNWTELRRSLLGDHDPAMLPPKIQLPMLPHAVLEFSRKADDPNSSASELARIVETDSGLTCDLLKYVNSSKVGIRQKVATAQQAITTLGIRPCKLFLLTAGVEHAMKSRQSKLINFQAFWLANLERALFAKEVARLLKANPDVAFAGSMLHDFMLPVLTSECYLDYLKYTLISEDSRPSLVQFERRTFGWDHSLATAQILMGWSFPDDLVCCVLLHHGGLDMVTHAELGSTAVAAVAVAALIPDVLQQSGQNGLQQLLTLENAWPQFELEPIAERVEAQMLEMSPVAQHHFSLKRRYAKLKSGQTLTAQCS